MVLDPMEITRPSQLLTPLPLLAGCLLYLLYFIIAYLKKKPRGLPYPPGPRGLPIIKNLFDLPLKRQWEGVADWSKKYGIPLHRFK